MTNPKKQLLPLAIALAACVVAPAAMAQSMGADATTAARVEAPAPPAQATPSAQAATPAVPASPAAPAAKSWSELDANGNGSLSANEAAPMAGLAKVFAKADADANGELTQDEYKAWLAATGKAKAKAGG